MLKLNHKHDQILVFEIFRENFNACFRNLNIFIVNLKFLIYLFIIILINIYISFVYLI